MSATTSIPLRARDGSVRAYALVDADDAERFGGYRWCLASMGYARRTVRVEGRSVAVYLHREIAGATAGQDVDHINRDRLDCRRANLRLVTRGENLQNVTARPGTSEHRGVSWHAGTQRWRACVKAAGRQHHLGLFDSEEEAAAAARLARARLLPMAVD